MSLVDEIRSSAGITDPELVGEGGFGLVFRAWQENLGRDVAVKVSRFVVTDRDAIRRFEDEFELA